MLLENMKLGEYFRFMFQQKNPSKLRVIINEAYIVLLITERINLGLERARSKGKRLGRPKGSKDKKIRRKSGYYQRWSKKSSPQKTT